MQNVGISQPPAAVQISATSQFGATQHSTAMRYPTANQTPDALQIYAATQQFDASQHSATMQYSTVNRNPAVMRNYAATHYAPATQQASTTVRHTAAQNLPSVVPTQHLPNTQNCTAAKMPVNYQVPPNEDFIGTNLGLQGKKIYPLPSFSGQPEEWQTFIEAFESTTKEFQYSNLHNIMLIRDALKGRARDTVEALLTNSANVAAIIETLAQNYGRPEQLIKSQVQKVRTILPVAEGDLDSLIIFANKIMNMSTFLQNAKGAHHLSNPILLNELVAKLPIGRQMQWAETCLTLGEPPTIVDFSKWLNTLRKIASTVTDSMSATHVGTGAIKKQYQIPATPAGQRRVNVGVASKQCLLCENKCTSPEQCNLFLKMSNEERWNKVKELKLCFSCLRTGHRAATCFTKKKCGLNKCNKIHHRLLHDKRKEITVQCEQSSGSDSSISDPNKTNNVNRNCHLNEVCQAGANVLFKIIPVKLYGPSKEMTIFAFVDEGSDTTILDAQIAHELEISGKRTSLEVQWFTQLVNSEPSEIIDLKISGAYEGAEQFHISKVFTSTNLSLPCQSFCRSNCENDKLSKLPIINYKDVQPKMIISLAHAFLIVPVEVPQTSNAGLTVVRTRLGWMAYGLSNNYCKDKRRHLLHFKRTEENDKIEQMLTSYFGFETFGVKPITENLMSKEDSRALTILNTSTKRVDDRFVTSLLWKENFKGFPESFAMAYRRLQCVEKKMARDMNYAQQYKEKIKSYLAKGYARRLTLCEEDNTSPKSFYLPHFAVHNPNKNGLRLVFDAAAEVNNMSLNKALLAGPDLNQSLVAILFKFREAPIAVCGDIAEMFHQIGVTKEDQSSLKFLWRDGDSSRPVEIYVMQRLIFGATCSPTIAQFVKNTNAKQFEENCPRAVQGIIERHYVDDYVDCFDTEEEAAEVTKKIIEIHKFAGFELRNILSNSDYVREQCGSSSVNQQRSLKLEGDCDRVLGMNWCTKYDVLTFSLKLHRVPPTILKMDKVPTKREMLSVIMSVFDPFGFLGNFMISAKLLMQSTWKVGLQWDQEIPENLCHQWRMWLKELPQVQQLKVPRCYIKLFKTAEKQLHLFADSSEEALAVVAYWRTEIEGIVQLSFVCAKTSCAPTRYHTIPKLELQAATMAVRLKNSIAKCHSTQIMNCFYWSDSTTTVRWIRGDHTKYKQYVANRVAEILEGSSVAEWRWCPGKLNPADEGTRSKFPTRYDPNSQWITGPQFLLKPQEKWPKDADMHNIADHCSDELRANKKTFLVTQVSTFENIINRFSNYRRLRRCISWVLRFTTNLLRKLRHEHLSFGELSAEEEMNAEILLCRHAQKSVFVNDYAALEKQGTISSSSALVQLNPYLDGQGLIRASGRIQNAVFKSVESCQPIILPKKHEITQLIARWYHGRFCHINRAVVINEIRRRFWIPSIREVLKGIESSCQFCKIRKSKPLQPQMSVLPMDRVTPFVRPFSYTGVDFFGPLTVTVRRSQEKRWVALFTCLSIRAVHLELAADLSSDAFIICLRNFMNRRGVPVQIRSDNGTNFVGVSKELAVAKDFLDHDRIITHLAPFGVKWIFNTPANPSEGGVWERLVQSIKKALFIILKEVAPRVETLWCLLLEAENIVNSRPLTHLPTSPDEPEPLTPNHFLLGCTNSTQTPAPYDPKLNCLRKQWRIAQNLKNGWWRQWLREYLPELTRRTKWCLPTRSLVQGSLVFICDPSLPRSTWRRGRVIELFKGKDGVIRSANVQTSTGILKRPISKLAVLDIAGSSGESSPSVSSHGGGDVVEMVTQN